MKQSALGISESFCYGRFQPAKYKSFVCAVVLRNENIYNILKLIYI